jgi:hypothetical protein
MTSGFSCCALSIATVASPASLQTLKDVALSKNVRTIDRISGLSSAINTPSIAATVHQVFKIELTVMPVENGADNCALMGNAVLPLHERRFARFSERKE